MPGKLNCADVYDTASAGTSAREAGEGCPADQMSKGVPGAASPRIAAWTCVLAPSNVMWPLRECTASSRIASRDRKSTRLNSSHLVISYAVFCLKKKKKKTEMTKCSRHQV